MAGSRPLRPGPSADPLDAHYRRARRPGDLRSSQALSTVAHASGCASCCTELTQVSEQLGQTPPDQFSPLALASSSRSQRAMRCTSTLSPSDLRCTVRGRPLASAGVCGGCYSVRNHAPLRGAAVGYETGSLPLSAWCRSRVAGVFAVAGQRRPGRKVHSCAGRRPLSPFVLGPFEAAS